MKNHTLLGAITLLFTGGAMAQSPEIAAYYLSGPDAAANTPAYYASLANLEALSQQVASQKSNFNKLVLREFNFEVRHSPMPPDGTLRIP